jgi:protein-disulfide isomerase-like protein with CxxC motif
MTAPLRKPLAAALLGIAPTLAKLIRMLSSDRDGEVVASVHAMRRVLANAGLSLHDFADAIELPAAAQYDDDADDNWRVMAKACARCPHLLSERERSFVTTMARWRGKPSHKQTEWLEAIYDRIREAAA